MNQVHPLTPEEIQRRNEFKVGIKLLKADIKHLSDQQRDLKRHRKTVHFTGERIYTPDQAVAMHNRNRNQLCYMFILYGNMRDKPVAYKDSVDQILIDSLKRKYFPGMVEYLEPHGEKVKPELQELLDSQVDGVIPAAAKKSMLQRIFG